ncbi:40S ribosomal protein S12-like [Anastrepha obliqua]|uniref:40S ribosomal protein S12-like n=1 Tax=Anastrepha obliqua TaxID=95512 RepID=UPI002409997A|nr:40S ribosomal protein S12-like [Anastrepha obliqua]
MADVAVDVPSAAPVIADKTDITTAQQEVLFKSLIADGLVHGIHLACKALDKRKGVLCILAESIDVDLYKKLVIALCQEHQIPLIGSDSHMKFGEWSGFCKVGKEGKPRKVSGCTVVVIRISGTRLYFRFVEAKQANSACIGPAP